MIAAESDAGLALQGCTDKINEKRHSAEPGQRTLHVEEQERTPDVFVCSPKEMAQVVLDADVGGEHVLQKQQSCTLKEKEKEILPEAQGEERAVGVSRDLVFPLEDMSTVAKTVVSDREEARRAEEAWRLEENKLATKRAAEAEELAREKELFVKKYAKPTPVLVCLKGDSSSDEEDEITRGRLLKKYDSIFPAKGVRPVNKVGMIHIPVANQPMKPDPEPIQGLTSSLPTSSEAGIMGATLTSQNHSLEEQILHDVKTELIEEQWMRKRKADIDAELTERVNKKFKSAKEDLFKSAKEDLLKSAKEDLLKSLYDDLQAGRVQLPIPEPSTKPCNPSHILSDVSNAHFPTNAPLVIPPSIAHVIPDSTDPVVSLIFRKDSDVVPCTLDLLTLSKFDSRQNI